jgi:hypothetical protein
LPSLRDRRRIMPTPSPSPSLLPRQQSWEPGGGAPGVVNVHNVVMLDGSKIAEVLNQHTMAEMNFPRQAPIFDGRSGWTTPDMQTIHGGA